jgi:hypothetical protein
VLFVSTKIPLKEEQRISADPNSAAPAVTIFSARKTLFPVRNLRERFVLGMTLNTSSADHQSGAIGRTNLEI